MLRPSLRSRVTLAAALACGGAGVALPAAARLVAGGTPLGTTLSDFSAPGSQPLSLASPIETYAACSYCHFGYDGATEPGTHWLHSLMGQSLRDPIFHAALAIAEQDAPFSGELCLRCHAPGGWLAGRSQPADGSAMFGPDFEGVSCNFCHRLVDPVPALENPAEDAAILAGLSAPLPSIPHSAQYVVDPHDRRRGPFDLGTAFPWHQWLESPYHQESLLCATCHDVSNPAFVRAGGPVPSAGDTYVLGALDQPHPTHEKYDEFPLERTFSEWAASAFAQGPVDLGGKFGGNKQLVGSCQDCHMPDVSGIACAPGFGGEYRTDLPAHDLNGANSWVLEAILDLDQSLLLYGPAEASQMQPQLVAEAIQRNVSMLERASELIVTARGDDLTARIVNDSGHKLPTGYGEGRRMWINVQFLDGAGNLVVEHGHYDAASATLSTADTVVYELVHGLDAAVAAATGIAPGPSFHFALNDTIEKDNRIPPRGFTNSGFEAVQSHPVGATYADGQHWDDTAFEIPCGATTARVRIFHQTTSREYVEFLRSENTTDAKGQIAYDLWAANGRSAPVLMDDVSLELAPRLAGDTGAVSLSLGGQQQLCLSAGAAHAGDVYWLIGTTSGTAPGLVVDGVSIPINGDTYTLLSITAPNTPPLFGSLGVLDAIGAETGAFVVPPGSTGPTLLGLTVHHAALVIDLSLLQLSAASNAVPVLLGS